jgi:hypothetical protein
MVIIIVTLLSYVKYFRFNEFYFNIEWWVLCVIYTSVSQPPGRGPVPDPGINYTGPREVNIL